MQCYIDSYSLFSKRQFKLTPAEYGSNNDIVVSKWNQFIDLAKEFKGQLTEFTRQESQKSKSFEYWSVFLDSIVPVLRDLTHSFREKDWSLHLSALQRAIPLLFSFDRTNYARWTPLYFNDCLKLEEKFPMLYQKFMEGDFCVQWTKLWNTHTIKLLKVKEMLSESPHGKQR